ncbi:phage major capsid protein, partial [Escherichia coli]|nr:phage major capsid protein [Escherichia coli]
HELRASAVCLTQRVNQFDNGVCGHRGRFAGYNMLKFAEQEEIAFTSGDGTKKPKGFLAYESTDENDKVRAFGKLQHIVSGEATAVTADAIIKLIYTLRKAHRTGAKFM